MSWFAVETGSALFASVVIFSRGPRCRGGLYETGSALFASVIDAAYVGAVILFRLGWVFIAEDASR